jgi:hypothetical protein
VTDEAPRPITSGGVAYVRVRLARWLGVLAAACYTVPAALLVQQRLRPPDPGLPVEAILEAFRLASAGAFALGLCALLLRILPRATVATLDRAGERLTVATRGLLGRPHLRILAVRAGHLVPDGRTDRAELFLANGDILRVHAAESATATAVLRLAGVDAAQQRARIRLSDPLSWLVACVFVVGVAALLVGLPMVTLAPSLGTLLLGALATALVSWAGMAYAGLPQITVGTDGISWTRGLRRGFIPLDEIASVRSVGLRLEVHLRGGRVRYIRSLTGADPAQAYALELRIREALATRRGEALPGQLALLDRRGRTVGDWSAAVTGLARAGSSYRAVGLSADDLAAIVVSPDVNPERRLGAALALRAAGDPAAGERIRVAAAQCASGRLRVALERVGEGEVDARAIEEALAETEASQEGDHRGARGAGP